jgi:hypothetical protein
MKNLISCSLFASTPVVMSFAIGLSSFIGVHSDVAHAKDTNPEQNLCSSNNDITDQDVAEALILYREQFRVVTTICAFKLASRLSEKHRFLLPFTMLWLTSQASDPLIDQNYNFWKRAYMVDSGLHLINGGDVGRHSLYMIQFLAEIEPYNDMQFLDESPILVETEIDENARTMAHCFVANDNLELSSNEVLRTGSYISCLEEMP